MRKSAADMLQLGDIETVARKGVAGFGPRVAERLNRSGAQVPCLLWLSTCSFMNSVWNAGKERT